jgi:hypothetical protein
MLLPAVSMLIGISIVTIKAYLADRRFGPISWMIALLVFTGSILHTLYSSRGYLFFDPVEKVAARLSGGNPFPESLPVAKYIEDNTSPDERILVLGSEPQIYFYSGRLSATGHIYMYGLMENHKYARYMQQEMIREIEIADPKIVVVATAATSWLVRPDSDTTILEWANRYAAINFDLVGIIDKIGTGHSEHFWGKDAVLHAPQPGSVIYVFKKKRFA